MFSGVERHAKFCKVNLYFDEQKLTFLNQFEIKFQQTRMVYEQFIQTYRFYKTCMIFMTSDRNVLVTTTGLGCSAYEQRDNPMGLCPPFSFEIHIN